MINQPPPSWPEERRDRNLGPGAARGPRCRVAGSRWPRCGRLASELLLTAKTQRWNPEKFLRTLIEAEISAREESNARTRMRLAAFPVIKTFDEFQVWSFSIPTATFDYFAWLCRVAGEADEIIRCAVTIRWRGRVW
jgi:hypothetical protein